MEKLRGNRLKGENGITLIALVVSIIVILLLAGVTISVLTGENGILTNVQKAKTETDEAKQKEEKMLKATEALLLKPWSGDVADSFAGGDGTEANPYQISNGEELAYFVEQVNNGTKFTGEYVEIVNSINMGNREIEPAGQGTLGGNVYYFDWIDVTNYFEGILDGKENVIANLKITQENMNGVGLIGVLGEYGEVRNLNIYKGNIVGKTKVGAVVGESKGTITNCHNIYTKVTAQDNPAISNSGSVVGGILGLSVKGTIGNCSNSGEIIAKNDSKANSSNRGHASGGIVGYANSTAGDIEITNCINTGTIKCEYQDTGGIVGVTNGTGSIIISNCKNEGTVETVYVGVSKSGLVAGGIVGTFVAGTISNCNNNGAITAERQQVGGILGRIEAGELKDCSNYGNIKSNGANGAARCVTGGIVGVQTGGTVKRVYNEGKVESENAEGQPYDVTGGIIGLISTGGEVKDSYNKGEVTGGDYQGGVVGDNQVANSISNCYYYLPQGSAMQGVGVARNGGDTNGTSGSADYLFNSLQEFISYFNITED